MRLLSAKQIREWDQYTMEHTPIASLDLMERAAKAFTRCFMHHLPNRDLPVVIFCGPGNNGGDGLAIARLLHYEGYEVSLYLCRIGSGLSPDFQANLKRLPAYEAISQVELRPGAELPIMPGHAILIDGIFGSGLNRPVQGYWARLIQHLNQHSGPRVAIDIPSGMFADQITRSISIEADLTISFQIPKIAFFWPENAQRVGTFAVVPIGLLPEFLETVHTRFYYFDAEMAQKNYQPRPKFGHKGTFGHALLIAGSFGMVGAAVLATKATLRTGAGLVSAHVPHCAYEILQSSIPEVIVSVDAHEHFFSNLPQLDKYQAIGVGPGLGQAGVTQNALRRLIESAQAPLVVDADALNLLAMDQDLLEQIPENSILTPHPGEFRRLFGESPNSPEQLKLLREKAMHYAVTIVLKGAYSRIALPDGRIYFNATGNPGMATAGSGDVLTGMLTALLAKGYPPETAALLGTYLHGKAGDLAAEGSHPEAMIARDIIDTIGLAYKSLQEDQHL